MFWILKFTWPEKVTGQIPGEKIDQWLLNIYIPLLAEKYPELWKLG